MKQAIEINGLTKDYGGGKGVFDLSFSVDKGEVFGFLGPNGAGKTTTIRNLMGFIRPDKGSCSIGGLDCTQHTKTIQAHLGYLPGEIALMDEMRGFEFLHFIAKLKGIRDFGRAQDLIDRFSLDPKGKIKKMSKGMKQKLGIVCAFMGDPDVLLLDEPTSGLDPLMQNEFVALILEEKKRGKTILMSSHIFEEVQRTCDRAAIIKNGRLMAVEKMSLLLESQKKRYAVTFKTPQMAEQFQNEGFPATQESGNRVTVSVQGDVTSLLRSLAKYEVTEMVSTSQTLEELFMHFYGGKK